MDGDSAPAGGQRNLVVGGEDCASAARYIARERQKQELRRERDVIVLRIAQDLGEQRMAEQLGVTRPVIDKLLADARRRLDDGASSASAPEIAVRRLPLDRDRWAQADAHYEALGGAPALSDRRGAHPRP